ncbi:hypothetical protein GA0115253_1004722 [Streptomyces sp. Termitarium-T10T-6]|nr:hypothetical protein [Streptomyces sp. Termitarium-T10T-6]SCD44056.1 hypothetical protein GA0115253_1004722 [Streptomyces sp. Termitarium-T10T-6]
MPFPEGVPSVPVRYSITSPADGGPGEGALQLMPTVPAIRVPGQEGVFTGGGTYRFVDGQLDNGNGEQVRLLPTNIDGANPAVWAWLGIEQINGQQPRHFYFALDADAGEVDLGAVQQFAPDLHPIPRRPRRVRLRRMAASRQRRRRGRLPREPRRPTRRHLRGQ